MSMSKEEYKEYVQFTTETNRILDELNNKIWKMELEIDKLAYDLRNDGKTGDEEVKAKG